MVWGGSPLASLMRLDLIDELHGLFPYVRARHPAVRRRPESYRLDLSQHRLPHGTGAAPVVSPGDDRLALGES